MISPAEFVFLFFAAFIGGAINAVAGGGSLISFPALLAAGVPSKEANVTNTTALWPGTLTGSLAYRAELRTQGKRIKLTILPSILGSIVGSAILLATPASAFDAAVPFLILFAVGVMAFQGQLREFARSHRIAPDEEGAFTLALPISIFILGMYGAYFGAGLGIMTLAALLILLPDDIHHSNALKGVLAGVMNGIAVLYFALFGPVQWSVALVMMAGALAGGYLGVGVARRLSAVWLRRAVIAYGLISVAVMWLT